MKKSILALMFVLLFGFTSAQAGVSFSIGTGNFYVSVGDYDYLPYSYGNGYGYRPRVSFYSMMSDYGQWVSVSPFGQVWRPYADYGWRPYVNGHWVYTQYGPTWQGYEPWAWAGYHYGNWVFSQQFGWVWIPGYDWHPGRVIWSQGYDTVGWMPAPPQYYDYSRGYLSYRGQVNQFTYNDPDFGYGYNDNYNDDYGDNYYDQGRYQDQYYGDSYSYGGPYYDSRYRDLYYNSSYGNVAPNLWVFIDVNNFNNDNYADYYLDRAYAQNVFNRRLVRISSAPVQRVQLERIVKRKLNEVPVEVKQIDTDKRPVRVIIPRGEEDNIRKNANRTVKEVIAPAFAEKQRSFKGLKAKNERELAKVFKQENEKPRFETIDAKDVIKKAQESKQVREERRSQLVRKKIDDVDKLEKSGKVRQPRVKKNDTDNQRNPVEEQRDRDRQFENQQRENQSDNQRNREAERERQLKLEKDQQAEQNRQNEIRARQDNELRNRQETEQIRAKRQQESEQQRQQDLQKRHSDTQKAEQERMKNLERERQFEQQPQTNNNRDERLRDTNPNSDRMQELRQGNDARSTKPSDLENQDRVKNNERDRNANQNDNQKEDRAKKNKNKDRHHNQNPDQDKPGGQK